MKSHEKYHQEQKTHIQNELRQQIALKSVCRAARKKYGATRNVGNSGWAGLRFQISKPIPETERKGLGPLPSSLSPSAASARVLIFYSEFAKSFLSTYFPFSKVEPQPHKHKLFIKEKDILSQKLK